MANIRTTGAALKCSAGNAIRIRILIRPYSLKPLFGTPLVDMFWSEKAEFAVGTRHGGSERRLEW